MKYKVGDRVKIKSLDWYNENKDEYGNIPLIEKTYSGYNFIEIMRGLCGKVMTISRVNRCYYDMVEDNGEYYWTDEMIEGLAEEEVGLVDNFSSRWVNEFNLPNGYIFKDENGNIINAKKIVLEKKKATYPKTYEECCKVMNYCYNPVATKTIHKEELIRRFQFLLFYRDAYWKLYGEEIGLGKPWEPDWTNNNEVKFVIGVSENEIIECCSGIAQYVFAFPTEEMRDAFKENFDPDIEICKELL